MSIKYLQNFKMKNVKTQSSLFQLTDFLKVQLGF